MKSAFFELGDALTRELQAGDTMFELDLSALPAGVYLMEVSGSTGRAVRRLVKV